MVAYIKGGGEEEEAAEEDTLMLYDDKTLYTSVYTHPLQAFGDYLLRQHTHQDIQTILPLTDNIHPKAYRLYSHSQTTYTPRHIYYTHTHRQHTPQDIQTILTLTDNTHPKIYTGYSQR